MLVDSIKHIQAKQSFFFDKNEIFDMFGMIFAERERERERESIDFFSKIYIIQPYHCFCTMLRFFLCSVNPYYQYYTFTKPMFHLKKNYMPMR